MQRNRHQEIAARHVALDDDAIDRDRSRPNVIAPSIRHKGRAFF
jgi:hypothetical protein